MSPRYQGWLAGMEVLELTGRRLRGGRLEVRVRCRSGHESLRSAPCLMDAHRAGRIARCHVCQPMPAAYQRAREAGTVGVNVGWTGRACRQCEGLPWRRPMRQACRCGEGYQAESPMTVADIFERPREDRRTFLEGA